MRHLQEALPSHELPEEGQGEFPIPRVEVLPSDAHQGELGLLLAQLHRVVTVLELEDTR